MANKLKADLGLTGFDEFFKTEQERQLNPLPKIHDIPLELIDDFPDHPYKVRMDEDMMQLIESIKENGVITPVTLRQKADNRYEIISGHRRKRACEFAGFETIRAEIQEMTRDEAIICMVESNFQRTHIYPSEKAFAYKMRLEAIKRQRKRFYETSSPPGMKLTRRQSLDIVGERAGESRNQVHRYIRLTELIPEILDMVDEGRIAFRPAVEISYLRKEEQEILFDAMEYAEATPSLAQAIRLKELSQSEALESCIIENILKEEKPNQREKISFRADRLRQFIPKYVRPRETEDYVCKALEYYRKYLEHQRRDRNIQ